MVHKKQKYSVCVRTEIFKNTQLSKWNLINKWIKILSVHATLESAGLEVLVLKGHFSLPGNTAKIP